MSSKGFALSTALQAICRDKLDGAWLASIANSTITSSSVLHPARSRPFRFEELLKRCNRRFGSARRLAVCKGRGLLTRASCNSTDSNCSREQVLAEPARALRKHKTALQTGHKGNQMMDAVFLLATLLFFTAAWAYARGCETI